MVAMTRNSYRSNLWVGGLLVIGVAAYNLSWLINPGVSLSLGAYDLAEWTSLHPVVRGSNPALWITLVLRLPMVCAGLIIACGVLQERQSIRLLLVFLIGAALLPPIEFFTQYRHDPNYQQQFFLALVIWAGGILSLGFKRPGYTRLLIILLALIGAVCSLVGLLQGYALMQQFDLSTQVGWGGIVLVGVYTLIVVAIAGDGVIQQTR